MRPNHRAAPGSPVAITESGATILHLTRRERPGEDAVIITTPEGRRIAVRVEHVGSRGGSIRLSFDADREVEILRAELAGPTSEVTTHE